MAGHRWDGASWAEITGASGSHRRRWTGAQWVRVGGWRWDGSSWVELWPVPGTGTGTAVLDPLFFNLDEGPATLVVAAFNLTKGTQ